MYTAVTQSDPLGKWQFPDSLPTGQIYLVSEVLQSGWKQTYPDTNGGVYRIQYNGAGSYVLKKPVPTGYVAGSLNFGNAPLGSIGNYVWNDADWAKIIRTRPSSRSRNRGTPDTRRRQWYHHILGTTR